MNFAWDRAKARQNRSKHRVSFEDAATVFGDPLAISYPDPEHCISEQRFITLGLSSNGQILIIAHADSGETARIISARQGNQK